MASRTLWFTLFSLAGAIIWICDSRHLKAYHQLAESVIWCQAIEMMTCRYFEHFILYAVQVTFYSACVCLSVFLFVHHSVCCQLHITWPIKSSWTTDVSLDKEELIIFDWNWIRIQEIFKDPFTLQDVAFSTLGLCFWKNLSNVHQNVISEISLDKAVPVKLWKSSRYVECRFGLRIWTGSVLAEVCSLHSVSALMFINVLRQLTCTTLCVSVVVYLFQQCKQKHTIST